MTAALLRDLALARATFQCRTLAAIINQPSEATMTDTPTAPPLTDAGNAEVAETIARTESAARQ